MSKRFQAASKRAIIMLVILTVMNLPAEAYQGQKIVKRIQFAKGRTTAVLKGTIRDSQEIIYVLRANEGQTLTAHISASTPNNDVVFHIEGPEGTQVMDEGDITNDWSGKLPKSGDYRIVIGMIESRVSRYTLEVAIR
jgi:hypothetical protein